MGVNVVLRLERRPNFVSYITKSLDLLCKSTALLFNRHYQQSHWFSHATNQSMERRTVWIINYKKHAKLHVLNHSFQDSYKNCYKKENYISFLESRKWKIRSKCFYIIDDASKNFMKAFLTETRYFINSANNCLVSKEVFVTFLEYYKEASKTL